MIIIFNKLINSDLSDCSIFENILNYHYEKFKFFYSLIKNLCLKNVEKISCQEKIDDLLILISFKTKPLTTNFSKALQDTINSNDYVYANHFILTINKNSNIIYISIMNKYVSKENEIYED